MSVEHHPLTNRSLFVPIGSMEDLAFKIVKLDGARQEVIASIDNFAICKTAFEKALFVYRRVAKGQLRPFLFLRVRPCTLVRQSSPDRGCGRPCDHVILRHPQDYCCNRCARNEFTG
jgi:hypothetical protein